MLWSNCSKLVTFWQFFDSLENSSLGRAAKARKWTVKFRTCGTYSLWRPVPTIITEIMWINSTILGTTKIIITIGLPKVKTFYINGVTAQVLVTGQEHMTSFTIKFLGISSILLPNPCVPPKLKITKPSLPMTKIRVGNGNVERKVTGSTPGPSRSATSGTWTDTCPWRKL